MSWTSWRLAGAGASIRRGPLCIGDGCPNQTWADPSEILTKDGTPAHTTLEKDYFSYWLRASSFGFSAEVGTTDVIYKVGVRYKIKCDTYPDQSYIDVCQLSTSLSAPDSIDLSDDYSIQNAYVEKTYEELTEEWFPSGLTATQVRDSSFSAWLSVDSNEIVDRTISVDSVEMRVYVIAASSIHPIDISFIGVTANKTSALRTGLMKDASIGVEGKQPNLCEGATCIYNEILQPVLTGTVGVTGVKPTFAYQRDIKHSFIGIAGQPVNLFHNKLPVHTAEIGVVGYNVGRYRASYINAGSVGVAGVKAPLPNQIKAASIGVAGNLVIDSLGPNGTATVDDLVMLYSGGATVTDQFDSLGGVVSSAVGKEVYTKYQHFSLTNYVNWAATTAAYGNPAGILGVLYFLKTPDRLEWTPHGYSPGDVATVAFTGAGDYVLGDATHGYLEVTCDGTIPAAETYVNVIMADPRHRLFDVVNPYEAYHGKEDYRCFYVKNTASNRAYGVTLWIEDQPPVGTHYELGVGTSLVGDGVTTGVEQTIATELVAPVGVTFSNAPINAPALLGTISGGEVRAFWVKRTVVPEVEELIFVNPVRIGIGAFI